MVVADALQNPGQEADSLRVTPSAVLDAALAWVDCTVHSRIDGGDHTIFIGRVVAAGAVDGTPLLY